jgi:chromosomal replication initiation ATPase DnaA
MMGTMEAKNKCFSSEAGTKEVIEMLSRKLGVDITDKSRKRDVTTARFVAFHWLRKMGFTCMEVAEMFGMHHSTVSYGVQEVDDFLSIGDKMVMEMCDKLRCLDVPIVRGRGGCPHSPIDAEIRI